MIKFNSKHKFIHYLCGIFYQSGYYIYLIKVGLRLGDGLLKLALRYLI